jgi:hypothetical protein
MQQTEARVWAGRMGRIGNPSYPCISLVARWTTPALAPHIIGLPSCHNAYLLAEVGCQAQRQAFISRIGSPGRAGAYEDGRWPGRGTQGRGASRWIARPMRTRSRNAR